MEQVMTEVSGLRNLGGEDVGHVIKCLGNGVVLHRHQALVHNQRGGADLQDEPFLPNHDPFQQFPNVN